MIRAILFDMFGTLVVGSASRTALGYHATHGLLRVRGIDIPYDHFVQTWSEVMDELDHCSAQTQQEYPMGRVVCDLLTALGAVVTPDLARDLMLSYVQERFSGLGAIPGVPGRSHRSNRVPADPGVAPYSLHFGCPRASDE
jgi:hypothetical protein